MAAVVGAQASVVSGGLLCLLGLVGVVRLFPELRHYVHDGIGGGPPGGEPPGAAHGTPPRLGPETPSVGGSAIPPG